MVLSHPAIAHFLGRVLGARFHVVLQAQRVAHFVRHDVFEQPPHQIVRKGKPAATRIERADLREICCAHHVEDVLMDENSGTQNLARAWIVNVRAEGIFDGRRFPVNDRIARVIDIPVRVFFL